MSVDAPRRDATGARAASATSSAPAARALPSQTAAPRESWSASRSVSTTRLGTGDVLFVDAVHPEQAQDRPLGRDRREGLGFALDALGDARREAAAAVDPVVRQTELRAHMRGEYSRGHRRRRASGLAPGAEVVSLRSGGEGAGPGSRFATGGLARVAPRRRADPSALLLLLRRPLRRARGRRATVPRRSRRGRPQTASTPPAPTASVP